MYYAIRNNQYEQCIKGMFMKLKEDVAARRAEPALRNAVMLKNYTLCAVMRLKIVPILQGYRCFNNGNNK